MAEETALVIDETSGEIVNIIVINPDPEQHAAYLELIKGDEGHPWNKATIRKLTVEEKKFPPVIGMKKGPGGKFVENRQKPTLPAPAQPPAGPNA